MEMKTNLANNVCRDRLTLRVVKALRSFDDPLLTATVVGIASVDATDTASVVQINIEVYLFHWGRG